MNLAIYDPTPSGNEYCTKMFLAPMRKYAADIGMVCSDLVTLADVKRSTVILLTDHLSEGRILQLKNNGNKIIGINVTDSSYISGTIRYAKSLELVDLIFMVSGVPTSNSGSEIAMDNLFNITRVERPFLDDASWQTFDYMRRSGRLASLPYVPWSHIPEVEIKPWKERSQKAILRGGGHARRFLLSLFLQHIDKLDPNSGFVLFPYFADDMNPQFRYCDACRSSYKTHHRAVYQPDQDSVGCNGPHRKTDWPGTGWDFSDLGQWNNRCPRSFLWMAEEFRKHRGGVDMKVIEGILNARWLHPKDHMEMLGRILFTSDLKWEHSIFMPQRFWEAAAAGCINVLPLRTIRQEYFPNVMAGMHYMVYDETMKDLDVAFHIDEATYNTMSMELRSVYQHWIAPSIYSINTNLLAHIFSQIAMA